jgi:hypothetical protein
MGESEARRGDWHTLDNEVRSEDTHGGDSHTRLGGSIGSTEAGEDYGRRTSHRTEEGLPIVSGGSELR